MKRFILLIAFLSVITSLTACSPKDSLELTNKEVDIITDKSKTGAMIIQQGENAGKESVPTSLYYTFTIKNTGNSKMGNDSETLKYKIVPNQKLEGVSKEVIGFNIFNLAEYNESGLGYGSQYGGVLEPNAKDEVRLHYDLGMDRETAEALRAPTKERLEKIRKHALDATLLVTLDNEEVARFDLNEK